MFLEIWRENGRIVIRIPPEELNNADDIKIYFYYDFICLFYYLFHFGLSLCVFIITIQLFCLQGYLLIIHLLLFQFSLLLVYLVQFSYLPISFFWQSLNLNIYYTSRLITKIQFTQHKSNTHRCHTNNEDLSPYLDLLSIHDIGDYSTKEMCIATSLSWYWRVLIWRLLCVFEWDVAIKSWWI